MATLDTTSSLMLNPFKTAKYFATPELTQRLNLIVHLLQNSEQLLLILAEEGCGKTTLLQQLTERIQENWIVYTPNSSPALAPDTLASSLLQTMFGVARQEGKNLHTLQELLRTQIATARYNGQLPILMVDDAHKLPLKTLQLIIELAMTGDPQTHLRVLLICEPQITSILAAPEFEIVHNTLIHTLDIPPLSIEQMFYYIDTYLADTPYQGQTQKLFPAEVIRKIFHLSEGIAGEINLLAEQILQTAQTQAVLAKQKNSIIQQHKLLWGTLIVAILSGIGLFLWHEHPELFLGTDPMLQVANPRPINPPSTRPPTISTIFTTDPIARQLVPQVAPDEPALKAQAHSALTPLLLTAHSAESTTTKTAEASTSPTHSLLETTVSTVDKTIKTASTNDDLLKSIEWLNAQNPNAYTLQILGAHDYNTLQPFLQTYQLSDIAIFKTHYREKDWYIVTMGIYASRKSAEQALATLPASLKQQTQPWIRTLASIQNRVE
ncbi:sporulation related protein [Beggiatoa alba B18LD]|uniref:Sporulation related protein n=1 Tax=Beggiatoa alba B18LD TaxID=395493 RepID=I3CIU6_9GAMM|nr:AAA family ATPase [Beggiatoa alba]EIJ43539.1 sporulation related protein [Beggiatoa alba B18LD]